MDNSSYSADKFLSLLGQLSRKAIKNNTDVSILLFGGGAMALYYAARERTHDLDALLQGTSVSLVEQMVADVAAEQGVRSDWLNDQGAKYITSEMIDSSLDFIDLPGVKVKVANPEAMLALKISAFRSELEAPDEDDIRFLLGQLKIGDEQSALAILEEYSPGRLASLTKYHIIRLRELIQEVSGS